jgi:hypothetical protein
MRGLVLPKQALKVLGLSGHASLADARNAHRALALKLHPDLGDCKHESEESARRRTEQLVIANAAREAIETAVRQGPAQGTWTHDARRVWDESSRKIHLHAMLGNWDQVLECISFGVDPNLRTPAQGAPPIFYASCCDVFGKASMGRGDEGRLRVLEVFASCRAVDLSLQGKAMWAEGRTIDDLVSMGRCSDVALDILIRGREAMLAVLSQGFAHHDTKGSICFAE